MEDFLHLCRGCPLGIEWAGRQVEQWTWPWEDHFARTEMSKKWIWNLRIQTSNFPVFLGPTFLACLQSHPLTCSRAEMVSGASQNLVAGPPEFLGCRDVIFVCRLSVCTALLWCCWLNHSRLEKPTSSKILTPLQNNIRSSASLHFQFKNWRDM